MAVVNGFSVTLPFPSPWLGFNVTLIAIAWSSPQIAGNHTWIEMRLSSVSYTHQTTGRLTKRVGERLSEILGDGEEEEERCSCLLYQPPIIDALIWKTAMPYNSWHRIQMWTDMNNIMQVYHPVGLFIWGTWCNKLVEQGGQRGSKFPKQGVLYIIYYMCDQKKRTPRNTRATATKWFYSPLTTQSIFFVICWCVLQIYSAVYKYLDSDTFFFLSLFWLYSRTLDFEWNKDCEVKLLTFRFEGVHIHIGWRV